MAYNQTTLRTGQATLSDTSAEFLEGNFHRINVRVTNLDAALTVYVGVGTVTASDGIPILAGESEDFPCVNALQAIAESDTPTIAFAEYSNGA